MIIVQILNILSPYYKMVPDAAVNQFLQEVERAYSQFGTSAYHFLTMPVEDPEKQPVVVSAPTHAQMPNPVSTQQVTGSFTMGTVSSQQSANSDITAQLPLIITGKSDTSLQNVTRSRSRSLSIDLLNQPSSALLRDRMSTITVIASSLASL